MVNFLFRLKSLASLHWRTFMSQSFGSVYLFWIHCFSTIIDRELLLSTVWLFLCLGRIIDKIFFVLSCVTWISNHITRGFLLRKLWKDAGIVINLMICLYIQFLLLFNLLCVLVLQSVRLCMFRYCLLPG